MIQLADHFRSDDNRRHSEWLRQRQWFIKAKEQHERRERVEQKLDDDLAAFATEVVMASEAQVAEFRTRLDRYDEATVKALMENKERLDQLYAERDALLDRAYVMDDGRRVFKSEDGSFVIDEFGAEVSADELDPDMIGPQHPSANVFMINDNAILEAEAEQERIIDYQEKLDETREAASDGKMTVDEMEDMDAELLDFMPASVRAHAGIEATAPTSDNTSTIDPPSRGAAMPGTQTLAPAGGTGQAI